MRGILVALGVWCAVGSLLAAPAPPREQKLLYPSSRTGKPQIFVMKPDGSGAKNLTDKDCQDTDPAWSPDGKKIAFTSDRSGTSCIYAMDADGKNVKQLTDEQVQDRAPAWSPDGKKIAFCRHVDNSNPEIFVMDADGTNQTNLTNDKAYDADPTWSPDGKKIAFASNRAGTGFRVYVMDADGKNVKDISKTDNTRGYVYPAWSPDGKHIAYGEAAKDSLEVFVCDPAGGHKKQLTKLGGMNSLAAWSPNGKQIAFQHVNAGDTVGTLYLMDADGGHAKEVSGVEGPAEGGRPAWAPKK
ncbi:MAG TPA: hypothetical protein VG013_19390 [Gemmataceae bacterium]|jgi:Tol biopolymer transport system component|nr:hypothetical protein [Gemmataceae bacterium]